LFSASYDSTAAQFDKTSGNLIKKFSFDSPLQIQVISVALSGDGQWLFSGTQDPTALLAQWRISDGTRVRTLGGILICLVSNDFHRPFEFSYFVRSC
jgi:WD40 repeat protein